MAPRRNGAQKELQNGKGKLTTDLRQIFCPILFSRVEAAATGVGNGCSCGSLLLGGAVKLSELDFEGEAWCPTSWH